MYTIQTIHTIPIYLLYHSPEVPRVPRTCDDRAWSEAPLGPGPARDRRHQSSSIFMTTYGTIMALKQWIWGSIFGTAVRIHFWGIWFTMAQLLWNTPKLQWFTPWKLGSFMFFFKCVCVCGFGRILYFNGISFKPGDLWKLTRSSTSILQVELQTDAADEFWPFARRCLEVALDEGHCRSVASCTLCSSKGACRDEGPRTQIATFPQISILEWWFSFRFADIGPDIGSYGIKRS